MTDELIDLVFRKKRIEDSFFQHPYMMFLVVSANTGISMPSPSWIKFFGYNSADEIPPLAEMMHPDDFEETSLMHGFILETGKMPIDFHTYKLKKKDGTYAQVQTMRSIVLNEDRDVLAIVFPVPEGQKGFTKYTEEYLQWINSKN